MAGSSMSRGNVELSVDVLAPAGAVSHRNAGLSVDVPTRAGTVLVVNG
jgi:hypothetical protein